MADLKTTNIYGDAYINNKVGIATNAPATRLQIGQLSPTAATEGIQFGDDTGARLYRDSAGIIKVAGGFTSTNYILAGNYLQTAGNLIYPSSQTATQRLEVGNASGNAWVTGIAIAQGGNVTVYNNLTVNNGATVTNDLTVNGNTYLGNANNDTVYVNDTIRIGATDSGDASLFFGEGSVAGSDYGARWYWDSGYTFTWYTRNAGTDTALFDYVTNDLNYINWRRHFHMQNKEINYSSQVHFNAGTRFVGNDTQYLIFRSDSTGVGGIQIQDGGITTKGYVGYWDSGGGGILNNTGNWSLRYNFGNANSGGTLYGAWVVNGNISATNLSGTNTGDQTVGNGTITIAAGTGVGVGSSNTFTTNQSGATTVTISNSGVTSNVAGTGISVSGATGAVTITNSGVTSLAGTTNRITVSGATGAVTLNLPQDIHTGASPTFAGLSLTSVSTTGATITNLTGAYQNTTVYDSPRTQSATPSRGIRAPASSIQFTDSYAIAPFYTYRSTGDWPVPYGIGWGTGGESSGIFQRYASNGSSFGDMIFYTGNDGSGAFSFRRHTWEGTTYFAAGSGELNTELFRIDWSGNLTMLGTLNGSANSATFYANNASYGSWRIGGTRNGWYGIEFESGTNLMANSNEVGFHRNGHGWQFWWSAGTGYVHKGNPGGGTQATILDSVNYPTQVNGVLLRAAGTPSGYGDWNTFGNATQTTNAITQEYFNVGIGSSTPNSNFPSVVSYRYGILTNLGSGADARAQIYISHAGDDLIFRGGWGTASWQTWNRCLTNVNSPYAYNMNQYVRTTDSPTFATITGTGEVVWSGYNSGNARAVRIGYSGGNYGGISYGINYTATSNSHTYAFNDAVTRIDLADGIQVYSAAGAAANTPVTWSTLLVGYRGNTYLQWKGNNVIDTSYSGTVSGLSIGGNATTATTLQTGRAINGVSFNGSAAITVNGLNYNVNNDWLRENGDDDQFKLYGNSRTMIYRTDGNTNAHGGGGYAHIFYYGGSADANRMFIINTDGRLWSNYHGWLDAMSITGNATTAGGLAVHGGRNNEANKIVRTDSNGYIQAGWINTPSGDMADTQSINKIYCSDDDYVRYKGVADFKQQIGLTYKNSTPRSTSTTDTNYWTGIMGWTATDWNSMSDWGCGFVDSWDSPANRPPVGGHHVGIQAIHYTNGTARYGWQMAAGGGNNRWWLRDSWGSSFSTWFEILTSTNYTSFAPSLTGTGASGNWAINVTGNAATVTNGIYTTNYWTGTPLGKRRNRIHSADSTSLNSSITNLECGFTYGGSGEPTGPFIAFGGLGGSIDYSCQLVGAYSGGGNDFKIRTRNDDTATWNTWRTIITDGNYSSYSPGLTGANASGTWSINITGNAGTATSATSATSATFLNSSNYIQRIGSSGNYNTDFQNTPAGSVRHQGDDYSQTNCPGGSGWWFVDNYRHSNASNYWGTQVAWGWEDQANKLATRNVQGGTFGGWVYYLNSNNYTDYTVTKTGTGASGTWSISISGNAATATTATNVTIANGSVTLAKIENITAYTILGNSNASAAATPAALSVATVATMLSGQTMNINGSSTSCSGNAATATLATKASTLSQGGGNGTGMTFNWSGQGGQPTWLWGSNDGTNIYVWNPSNFNVNYATSAGSATSATNATTAGGLAVQSGTNYDANKIVRTDGNGYILAGWINTISGDNGTTAIDRVYASSDGYIRYYTPANFRTVLDVPTRNGSGVTNFGINTAPSNRLHINGDNANPSIRVDNGAVVLAASAASNSKTFYGWLPISIAGTTKWIQMYN